MKGESGPKAAPVDRLAGSIDTETTTEVRQAEAKHPAQFSPEVLDLFARLLPHREPRPVHDPFAGPGLRLGRLCDRLGLGYSGGDLDHIVTSPTYGNGLNDHFAPQEGSRRYTYRVGLGRALHAANTGRHGVRGGRKAEARYWDAHDAIVGIWADLPPLEWAAVNVSDFIYRGEVYPLADRWAELLAGHGFTIAARHEVATRRMRHGANGSARVPFEVVFEVTR